MATPTEDPEPHYSKSSIITIIVGPERETFTAHRALLVKKSKYFRACLEQGFVESFRNTVELLDCEPFGVQLFVDWLYTSVVNFTMATTTRRFSAYVFADRVGSEAYQNAFLDGAQRREGEDKTYPHPEGLIALYDAGLGSSPMSSYGLKCLVWSAMHCTDKWLLSSDGAPGWYTDLQVWAEAAPQIYQDFIAETLRFTQTRNGPTTSEEYRLTTIFPDSWPPCYFHVHKEEASCTAAAAASTAVAAANADSPVA